MKTYYLFLPEAPGLLGPRAGTRPGSVPAPRLMKVPKSCVLKKLFVLTTCLLVSCAFYLACRMQDLRFSLTLDDDTRSRCNIPHFDPFDKSIREFVFHPQPLSCADSPDLTYLDGDGIVRMNFTASRLAGFDPYHARCEYNNIARYGDDDSVLFAPSRPVTLPADVPAEFFRITCKDESGSKYTNLHAHVSVRTAKNRTRVEKLPGYCAASPGKKYSVFVFGVDSVSRLNGIRKLPRTYKYLTDVLGAYDFRGYTKVGDNTFPNLVPVLTGKDPSASPAELPAVDLSRDFFDSYPLVWKNFSDCGYTTMFGEDMPKLGLFNYLAKGFLDQPTDHYMRPFWLAMEESHPVDSFLSPLWLALENSRIKIGKSSTLCFGGTPKHMLLVKYYGDFVRKYRDAPRFGFTWLTELGHNHLNIIELADDDFLEFLQTTLQAEGHLNDTFLFFMSDHGHRFDSIRHTLVGRVEERMPLVLVKTPNDFRDKFPTADKHLRENVHRLTTPYDVHETLKDILKGTFEKNGYSGTETKGISLFKPISMRRTCAQASISEHYCACYKSNPVNTSIPIIQHIGTFILGKLNTIIFPLRHKCSELALVRVKDAEKRIPNRNLTPRWGFLSVANNDHGAYVVVIETSPGFALFEATVSYQNGREIELLGDINRINRYGNQSHCMEKRNMKLYCYCTS